MKEITVKIEDSEAKALKQAIDHRRAEMKKRREELRYGRKAGSNVAELSDTDDVDVPLDQCVKASIKFTTEEL